MSCTPVSHGFSFSINVLLHVVILFVFLSAFFILFVSKLTQNLFENEIGNLIETNMDKIIKGSDNKTKESLMLFTKLIPIDKLIKNYEQPSEYNSEHNKWVQISAIAISFIGVFTLALIVFLVYNICGKCMPLTRIILENIIVFACVGLVEYFFFTEIALKFVPAPPSLLITSLINKFKENLDVN